MPGIASLKPNASATFEGTITAISETRDVSTSRGPSKVADATIQDDTGTISLTLWGADTTKYKVGQKIRVVDGWAKEYRGKLQLSLGPAASMRVVRA